MKKIILVTLIISFGIFNAAFGQTRTEIAYFQKQLNKAREERKEPTGAGIKGLIIPAVLSKDNISKQDAKLIEMENRGFQKPWDFADLALKVQTGEFVEIPLVTDTYVLDIGGNVTEDEFTEFNNSGESHPLTANSPKYSVITKYAENSIDSQIDLNREVDRKKIKIKLLRTLNPKAKAVLEKIAADYNKKFARPLRITSAARSVEYQNSLDSNSSTSFSSHLSGCAFDMGFRNLTAKEQNFLMAKFADLEREGVLDALREEDRTVFHIFVYPF